MPPCAGVAGFDATNANRAMITLSFSTVVDYLSSAGQEVEEKSSLEDHPS